MLTIKKPVNDTPCFSTGSTKDCYLVHFKNGSFTGVLCWDALLVALKRNAEQANTNGLPAAAKDSSKPE